MIIDGYTSELLIDRAIGGTTLEEGVKALQDVFVDHDQAEKGEPMSDLIDRQAVLSIIRMAMPEETSGSLLYQSVKQLPTVDAVEVVRCKDCKYYHPIGICIEQSSAVCADSFCCWAERRTDE